ncbi:hypothetical protein CLU79DRAFT_754795 [Phycomyces nitens]|nr:hypothetical protein CLU79DRAFT_754795 [Phycomyces nitens]
MDLLTMIPLMNLFYMSRAQLHHNSTRIDCKSRVASACGISCLSTFLFLNDQKAFFLISLGHLSQGTQSISSGKIQALDFKRIVYSFIDLMFLCKSQSTRPKKNKQASINIVGCISMSGTTNVSKVKSLKRLDYEKITRELPFENNKEKRKAASIESLKSRRLKKPTTAYHTEKFI